MEKKESIFINSNWMLAGRRMQREPCLSPYTKLKSMCIKDINTKPNKLNLLEEKVGSRLECIGTGDNFLKRMKIEETI